jgi:hypothetical protein
VYETNQLKKHIMKKLCTFLIMTALCIPFARAYEFKEFKLKPVPEKNQTYILKPMTESVSDDGIKGKILLTAGVGFNVFGTILEARYLLSSYYDFEGNIDGHTTSPMINLMLDYGLGKRFSVGAAFGYQTAKINFKDVYTYGDSYHDTWTRIHLAVRGDFHIIAKENVTMYTGLKFGYNLYTVKTNLTTPGYLSNLDVDPQPISVQAHYGFSYFFNDMIGFNLEVGLGYGGPYLFAAGIAVKL